MYGCLECVVQGCAPSYRTNDGCYIWVAHLHGSQEQPDHRYDGSKCFQHLDESNCEVHVDCIAEHQRCGVEETNWEHAGCKELRVHPLFGWNPLQNAASGERSEC